MTKEENKLFRKTWLRTRGIFLIGFLGFGILIALVSNIFDIEVALVNYTLLLLGLIAALVIWVDVSAEYKKFRRAVQLQGFEKGSGAEVILQERLEEQENQIRSLQGKHRLQQEELQDYYTMWAHQMKVPIAASQLLVGDLEVSEHKRELTQELFKIERYTSLVLNYLRLQSFHDDLILKEENLAQLINQTVKMFSLFFIQQGIKLNLGDLDRTIVTDKKWFGLLLEQFLSNAVKYTKEGSISIYLEGDDLVIADTGIGIAKDELERVFDRGFSGYNGRLTQKSSGLGLYLSRKIADALDLKLALTSQVGVGTQVRICIKQEKLSLD